MGRDDGRDKAKGDREKVVRLLWGRGKQRPAMQLCLPFLVVFSPFIFFKRNPFDKYI